MTNPRLFGILLLLASLGGVTLVTSSPSSAMPGWTHPGRAAPAINAEQRDMIQALHVLYRAAVAELDWSVDENGHAPESVEQARNLRLALQAEIKDVLARGDDAGKPTGKANGEGVCPFSGQTQPVNLESKGPTLYL